VVSAKSSGTLTTQDSSSKTIDTASGLQTDEIQAGAILSGTFLANPALAGSTSTLTITFTTVGRVVSSGYLQVVLSSGATSSWQNAALGGSSAATLTWDGNTISASAVTLLSSTLKVVTSAAIPHGKAVTVSVTNVANPTVAIDASTASLTTKDSGDGTVAETSSDAITVAKIDGPPFEGLKQLVPTSGVWTPGTTVSMQIKFTTAGAIPSGGRIQLTDMASGWSFAASPSVTSSVGSISSASYSSGTLTIVLGAQIAQGVACVMEVNVNTPSSVTGAGTANLSAQNQINGVWREVNQATALAVTAVTVGALTSPSGTLQYTIASGVGQVTCVFTATGNVATGGYVEITFPFPSSKRHIFTSASVGSLKVGATPAPTPITYQVSPSPTPIVKVTTTAAITAGAVVTVIFDDVEKPRPLQSRDRSGRVVGDILLQDAHVRRRHHRRDPKRRHAAAGGVHQQAGHQLADSADRRRRDNRRG
jgi:hypothetical protein